MRQTVPPLDAGAFLRAFGGEWRRGLVRCDGGFPEIWRVLVRAEGRSGLFGISGDN